MPAVVVDSSVLITLAAGAQFDLLRALYTTLYVPPEVWNEVTVAPKPFGTNKTCQARDAGWLMVRSPASLAAVRALPFNLQPGETEALALPWNWPAHSCWWMTRKAAAPPAPSASTTTGTLGVLLRAKAEGQLAALRPVPALVQQRTTFWLSEEVCRAALAQAGEAGMG